MSVVHPAPALQACGCIFSLEPLTHPWSLAPDWTRVAAQLREQPLAVAWRQDAAGVWLDLGDCGRALYQPQRQVLQIGALPADPDLRAEVLYGPLLLHALAWQGWYGLHAACVRLGAAAQAPAVALIASSGTGKSTLARVAHGRGWQRLSDDVLPYRIDADGLHVRADFPQLKLPPPDVPAPAGDQRLHALVLLQRGAAPALRRLDAGSASRALLMHTLGSRLYTDGQLRAQFAGAAQAATAVARGTLAVLQLTVTEQADVDAAAQAALDQLRAALA